MSGLTEYGFESKTLEEIIADQISRAETEFGTNIKTGPDEVMGHLIGIQGDGLALIWAILQVLYDATNPDNAQGQSLDNLARIVGVSREPATKASGTVTAYGTDLTLIPAGSIVAAPTLDDSQFVTTADATIGDTTPGEVDIAIEAELAGGLVVYAGEVDTIITPVSGWDSVTNAADLAEGNPVESDSELRRRREESLAIIGAGTDAAIRAKVLALDDVDTAVVLSNRTMTTDGNGIPAKAFRTVVWPNTGVDEERVAAVIFENMPSGIEPDGALSFDVTDEQGITHSPGAKFSYATQVPMGVIVDVVTKLGWPADGQDQVENAVLKAFTGSVEADPELLQDVVSTGITIGDDVEVLYLSAAIKTVPGIKSITLKVDKKSVAFPPTGLVDVTIGDLDIAELDSTDLTVNIT